MATFVRMPQKGLTEESAILSKWHVKKGDTVKEGQYLFALETGKATFDVEAEVSGTVLELIGNEGDEIAVKAVVLVIGSPGESYTLGAAGSSAATGSPEKTATPAASPEESAGAASTAPAGGGSPSAVAPGGELKASPRARRLADQNGLPLAGVAGTGPGGRIIEEDVKAALKAGAAVRADAGFAPAAAKKPSGVEAGEFTVVQNDRMRRTIAANMLASLQGSAQFTMMTSFDAAELLAYRERYNAANDPAARLSVNDLIVFAVSRVILDFPIMNAHYSEAETRMFVHASIGVAVDTPKGLMVPTVKNADEISLAEISARIKDLARRCREEKASADELSGGTFTISNIGALGVEYFTPIINPPQTGILGVGKIEYKRKKTSAGMSDYPALGLSLTADHRAVDGAPAAGFLEALAAELEHFPLLLAK